MRGHDTGLPRAHVAGPQEGPWVVLGKPQVTSTRGLQGCRPPGSGQTQTPPEGTQCAGAEWPRAGSSGRPGDTLGLALASVLLGSRSPRFPQWQTLEVVNSSSPGSSGWGGSGVVWALLWAGSRGGLRGEQGHGWQPSGSLRVGSHQAWAVLPQRTSPGQEMWGQGRLRVHPRAHPAFPSVSESSPL